MLISTLLAVIAAQSAPAARIETLPPQTSDVVVEGQREILRRPVNPDTVTAPGSPAGLAHRKIYDNAQRVARCILRQPRGSVRMAIDAPVNSVEQRRAMGDLIERTAFCNSNPNIVRQSRVLGAGGDAMAWVLTANDLVNVFGENNPQTEASLKGVSVYDRGTLLEEVLAAWAPGLTLTRRETYDPAIQKRFDTIEVPRNSLRTEGDFKYLATVVCMVRMEPALAIAMLRAPAGSINQGHAQANIIDRARACVGNARKVKVDGVQFRAYVADAVYRWAVAAKNVKTLIPSA
jgi:hypothetical protein